MCRAQSSEVGRTFAIGVGCQSSLECAWRPRSANSDRFGARFGEKNRVRSTGGAQLPRALRQQRWSPLNVPLIWAAAGNESSTPVLEWLVEAAEQVPEPVEFHGGQAVPSVCAREGWAALRGALRSWGVADREDLSHWLGTQGFPRTSPGNHISARAQEFILGEATTLDARCASLEAVFVLVTLNVAREMTGNAEVPRQPAPLEAPRRVPPTVPSDFPLECWQQLDQVDLSEVFLQRIPMLKL